MDYELIPQGDAFDWRGREGSGKDQQTSFGQSLNLLSMLTLKRRPSSILSFRQNRFQNRVTPDAASSRSGQEAAVRLWTVPGGKLIATLAGSSSALAFSPDGSIMATSAQEIPEDI